MRPEILGLIVGGILPALTFGVTNVVAKIGAQNGVNAGYFMLIAGIGVTVAGFLISFLQPESVVPMTPSTMRYAALFGLLWGVGSGLVIFALSRYQVPMSKLVPLFNMNTLISVALILIIFAEWKTVNLVKLIVGTIFIVIGGILVSVA